MEGIARLAGLLRSGVQPGRESSRVVCLATRRQATQQLAKRSARRLAGEIRADGSLGGAFVSRPRGPSCELHDLGGDPCGRRRDSLDWLLGRQEAPGSFGEGCTPPRHVGPDLRALHEGVLRGGAAHTERVAPLTVPTGKVIRSEGTARFAASCLALRAVILAGHRSHAWRQNHLEGLPSPRLAHPLPTDHYPMELVAGIPLDPGSRRASRRPRSPTGTFCLKRQTEDGTWPGLDSFMALERAHGRRSERALRRGSEGDLRRSSPASDETEPSAPSLARSERVNRAGSLLGRVERSGD